MDKRIKISIIILASIIFLTAIAFSFLPKKAKEGEKKPIEQVEKKEEKEQTTFSGTNIKPAETKIEGDITITEINGNIIKTSNGLTYTLVETGKIQKKSDLSYLEKTDLKVGMKVSILAGPNNQALNILVIE